MQAIRMQSYPLIFLSFTFLFPQLLLSQKDHFKAYLKAPLHEAPSRFQGNKILLHNNGKDFLIAGELKAADPDFENYAFITTVSGEGEILENYTLKSQVQNANDGVRASSLLQKTDGTLLLGGAYTGNWSPLGTGSERTLTALTPQGQILWSNMQSSFYFADLLYEVDSDQIISIAGPQDLINPDYNLQIAAFDKDGKAGSAFSLQTNSQDYGIALEEVSTGYVFAANSYLAGQGRILLGLLDKNFNLQWSKIFKDEDLDFEISDMKFHKEAGILACAGSVYDNKSGEQKAFLMGISQAGELTFYKSYERNSQEVFKGLGLSPYTFEGEQGFLLVGSYYTSDPNQRRSLCIKTDLEGEISWSQSYSYYAPGDNSWDEVLRDVVFAEGSKEFVAIGDVSRYKNGISIDRKALVMIRAGIREGELNEGEACYESLNLFSQSNSLAEESIGIGSSIPNAVIGFAYQQPSLAFQTGYCSFGSDPEPPENRYNGRGVHVGSQEYLLFKSGRSRLNIEWKEFYAIQNPILEIMDIRAHSVYQIRLHSEKDRETITLPSLSHGLYFVRIIANGHYLGTERLILGE